MDILCAHYLQIAYRGPENLVFFTAASDFHLKSAGVRPGSSCPELWNFSPTLWGAGLNSDWV